MPGTWRNWAGSVRSKPESIARPTSVAQLQEAIVASGRTPVRMAGSGHSFTPIVPSTGLLLLPHDFGEQVEIDSQRRVARIPAGMVLDTVNQQLSRAGWALANMGDITAQTVAGALATSTHGTGLAFTGLGGQVAAFEIVTADGNLLRCSPQQNTELFRYGRVSLGALGVFTHVEMQVVPSFRLRAVETAARVDSVLESFHTTVDSIDHFEFYWVPHTRWALLKSNTRTDEPAEPRPGLTTWYTKTFLENYAFGAVCALGRLVPSLVPRLATALPGQGRQEFTEESHKVFATRRLVRFHEMEYSIPLAHLPDALGEIMAMVERERLRISFPVEVRATMSDDVPLSTSYGRNSAYVAVHMYRGVPFERYFRLVEEILAPMNGRPHWGKIHYQNATSLRGQYPDFDGFNSLRSRVDPNQRFSNDYVRRVLGIT